MPYDSRKGAWRGNAQDAQYAAEGNALARSGKYLETKSFIEDLLDDELRLAHDWPRFRDTAWAVQIIQAEQQRRGI